jgi:ATP-dependent protease ClpP protease subunit
MNVLVNGEIVLFGTVGAMDFFEEGFTAMDVVNALAEVGRNTAVTVRINSGGGLVDEGIAIYNALDAHRGGVKVVIEGVAASAASVIAMAGDEIIMRHGAQMMVHEPSAYTEGDAAEHAKSVEWLGVLATSMADIYSERAGRKIEEIREEMKAETWMSARDAVSKGYADKIEKGKTKEPTAFDYRVYTKAPERMVALAKARGWQFAADNRSAEGNDEMTDEEKAAAAARAAAKAAADKAKAEEFKKEEDEEDDEDEDEDKEKMSKSKAKAMADAAVAADRQRSADIHAACQMVGKPEKAVAFIAEGKSLSEVVAALQGERASGKDKDVNAHHNRKEPLASLDKYVDRVNARFSNGRAS